jgi:hypothetical protein
MFGIKLASQREVPKNPEYISATRNCLQELSPIGVNLCAGKLFDTIPALVQDLGEFLDKNKQNLSLEQIHC